METVSRPYRVWKRTVVAMIGSLLLVGLAVSALATDPYAASLDSLDKAVKARVDQMAQTPVAPPPPAVGQGNLMVVFAIFLTVILAWRIWVHRLNRRLETQDLAKTPEVDPLGQLYLEEPSLAAFFDQLQSGKAEAMAVTATALPLDETSPLTKFFAAAPAALVQLQAVLLEIRRTNDNATQKKKLLELATQLHGLNYEYCRIELGQIGQLAVTLEEMMRQLAAAKTGPAASALQTLSSALSLFKATCDRQLTLPEDKVAPAKLLIVDANSLTRSTLSAALKKAFNPPDTAAEVAATLTQIGEHTYDGIFLDLETPGLNAVELAATIRASKLNAATPLVFITKQADLEARAKELVKDGQQLLARPFLFTEATLAAVAVVVRCRLERGATSTEAKPAVVAKKSEPAKPASVAAVKESPSVKPALPKAALTPQTI